MGLITFAVQTIEEVVKHSLKSRKSYKEIISNEYYTYIIVTVEQWM